MFEILRFAWFALALTPLIVTGVRYAQGSAPQPQRSFVRAGVTTAALLLVMVAVETVIYFYIEHAWFAALSASGRFWTEYGARFAIGVGVFLVSVAIARPILGGAANALTETKQRSLDLWIAAVVVGGIVGLSAAGAWQEVLLFLNRASTGMTDPAFGLPLEYYLFTLPFIEVVLSLIGAFLFFLLIALVYVLFSRGDNQLQRNSDLTTLLPAITNVQGYLRAIIAIYFLRAALQRLVDISILTVTPSGAVYGAGWLNVHVDAPMLVVASVVYLAAGVWVLTVGRHSTTGQADEEEQAESPLAFLIGPGRRSRVIVPAVLLGVLIVARGVVPGVVRSFVVEPNEITMEEPYLRSNIAFTRAAYGIGEEHVTSTEYEAGTSVTPALLEDNSATLDNIRLWDPLALLENLREQQEIRLYYQFNDVDIDRYQIDGDYTQMMLSIRELEQDALADVSDTWVARHLKYTHGYGLVALPVHEIRSDGRPEFVVKNIPAEATSPRLNPEQPRIYYGERTDDHVYISTSQREFDYPSGDENVFNSYDGTGGVPIGGALRRFVYASRIDGVQQLFSSYIQEDTRLLWRRNIMERAQRIAPFLQYDEDPYPVVTEDGEIVFVLDAYTTARTYPYSQHYQGRLGAFSGVNYIRNSVKVFIDAYDGTVTLYAMTDDDPVLNTYRSVFPDLFRDASQMPAGMKRHIRYPIDLMTVQAELYNTYHITDPDTFYQREDVWEFATERYREGDQAVEPYFAMVDLPGEDTQSDVEYVTILPFTPSNKNVVHAWMAARSDQPNYGQLLVYTFPKGEEVLGPRQIEARIDQNTEMSRALSLWSQRGSAVIRGNLLAIPLFDDNKLVLLYTEPIFLQAENSGLPEIKRIALADQQNVVWSNSFDTAIEHISEPPEEEPIAVRTGAEDGATGAGNTGADPEIARRTRELLKTLNSALGAGNYGDAGAAIEDLQNLLEE
jgi:uncharacterized membrane protein (UPF0182 family)